jgi:hypothetical protein
VGDFVSTNRIGDPCWYGRIDAKNKFVRHWRQGFLRAWSTDHEASGSEQPFPVGVIEDFETKMCYSVYVERICFAMQNPADPDETFLMEQTSHDET